jgi:hypothetical protein
VYNKKWKKSPSLSIARFSLAKVENVVNPPQKPTVRNIFHPELNKELLSDKPYISPIRKHPVIFTKKVPKGKAEGKLFCIIRDVRNLDTLPRNPPVPINSNVLIIICRNALICRLLNIYAEVISLQRRLLANSIACAKNTNLIINSM